MLHGSKNLSPSCLVLSFTVPRAIVACLCAPRDAQELKFWFWPLAIVAAAKEPLGEPAHLPSDPGRQIHWKNHR